MQSPEERINIIRDAVENIQVADNSLDLNNALFSEISNSDNEGLTLMAEDHINAKEVI